MEKCRFHSIDVSELTYKTGKVTKKNRTEKIDKLLFRIASVECVVTDQLHGIILCAVTGTPCVALSKSCPGTEAGCKWIRDLEYIRFIHDIAELETAIDYVCSCADREYPEKKIQEQFLGLVQYLENQGGDGIQPVQPGLADKKKTSISQVML